MEKIARQSRLNSTSKLLKSAAVNENDVMIIWVLINKKTYFRLNCIKLTSFYSNFKSRTRFPIILEMN